ncbi:hypothetical protein IWW37_001703 [Coemansia sp. RSA 2050]|nr:hypothetical protein IWW37_001703 [Coemansia sp. RSA 2050]KAJ2735385.1 hypothetical protein IW152_001611 [Coemansia sp. BCRC 34962]
MTTNQDGRSSKRAEAPMRRFREMHYHRFQLGTRSNIHGTCLMRSALPVRLPRPHAMQMIYQHPPPGVGFLRLGLPQGQEAKDQAAYMHMAAEHDQAVMGEIAEERARTAQWLASGKAIARTHVVVATQSGLQFFVAGFGYWNILDIDLKLTSESCVGVKAFEMWAEASPPPQSADPAGSMDDKSKGEGGEEVPPEAEGEQMAALPVLIIALTTYVKRPSEIKNRATDELGRYRLYALGADSLPPLSQEFVDKHALTAQESFSEGSTSSRSESMSPPYHPLGVPPTDIGAQATSPPTDGAPMSHADASVAGFGSDIGAAASGGYSAASTQAVDALPVNTYAYLEERLFSLRVSERTVSLDLDYLPFRISQDVAAGMPAVLLVAGNDNKIHRYALGCDRIVEIEPLLCPKTDVPLTFTAFDGRVIGPYHVQITAHQEFAVALQVSRALGNAGVASEAEKGDDEDPAWKRRLLIADEEVYDAAPILATVFTPEAKQLDRTAFDYAITHRVSVAARKEEGGGIVAGDIYNSKWPIGTTGTAPSRRGDTQQQHWLSERDQDNKQPRVHAMIGFVGEDAVVYHDVAVAGLDPVPTLVGGVACKVPDTAPHISGRLGGLGGVFSLPGSAKEGLITSVHFDDLDYSGTKEIIVGTVSGAVLIYKEVEGSGYILAWKRRFPAPAYGIFSVDINCDGANELVVVTLLGVHVMQPNLSLVRAKLLRQLILAKKEDTGNDDGASNASE